MYDVLARSSSRARWNSAAIALQRIELQRLSFHALDFTPSRDLAATVSGGPNSVLGLPCPRIGRNTQLIHCGHPNWPSGTAFMITSDGT